MIQHENGYKYSDNYKWEIKLHQPYDYTKFGILNKILSHKIIESKNPIIKFLIQYYDKSIVFILNYVDLLFNYKNYIKDNR